MLELGLFDLQMRMDQLHDFGNPLERLKECVDWEVFRSQLETIREKERNSPAAQKPYNVVLMFKILILQSLYNLSDPQAEFQIKDRLAFLDLPLKDRVPDEKTIWLFREQTNRGRVDGAIVPSVSSGLRSSGLCRPERGDH